MRSSAPIRVLHVVFSLGPGGMENGLVNVASRLNPDEFQVDVCCLTEAGEFRERLPKNSRVVVLSKKPGFSWRAVIQLALTIFRLRPHVIHSHNLGPLIYSALATGGGRSCPILHGEHGMTAAHQLDTVRRRRLFYRPPKIVHAVSYELRMDLIRHGVRSMKTLVVLNGVDTDRYAPLLAEAARAKINIPPEGPVLGMVGRFELRKRHMELIDAFAHICRRWPTAQLLLVGDRGEARDKVFERARSSPVADRIHLVGFQREPAPYYQAMDLLVSPSLHEGLSNAVMEAMSCGVPVLAHKACGNQEIITPDMDGWIADLASSDDLTSQLDAVLSAPERLKQLGQAARGTICRRFALSIMVNNYASLYRQLAGQTA